MSEILGELLEEEQVLGISKAGMPGWILNLLSLLLVASTVLIGLMFGVLYIFPQSRFNPLPPTSAADQLMALVPSATPRPGLPPTWTPTISPAMAPTRTPVVPDQPITIPDNTPLFGTDLESGAAYNEKPGSHNFEFDAVPPGAGCNLPEGAGQIILETGFPAAGQIEPRLNQPQLASALNVPFPTLQSPVDAPVPEEGISDLFTPEIQYWEEDILAWAVDFEMDPNLIAAVMQIESCGYSRAKSAAGAMGLFQVMPHHFKNREDPYDPDTNAYRGLSWLQQTLRSGGSTAMALASYNAGIARAKNPHLDWPAETRRYVFWGINLYQDAADGYETSYALDNWLSKGGSALCSRAAAEQQDP